MSKFLHIVLQVLSVVVQVVNVAAIPSPYNVPVGIAISALQAGLAVVNHGGSGAQAQASK